MAIKYDVEVDMKILQQSPNILTTKISRKHKSIILANVYVHCNSEQNVKANNFTA